MPGWIGPWEIAILLVIVLLVFGPKRLPEMGRSLGRGMREFKSSITGKDDGEDEKSPSATEDEKPATALPMTTTAEAEVEQREPASVSSERDS